MKTNRVTLNGQSYQIDETGVVRPVLSTERPEGGTLVLHLGYPLDPLAAKAIKTEAGRQRRNRASRARYTLLRSMGLKKTPYGWE